MTTTRKRQTVWLVALTAATLMPSYSLQGWLAGGHAASVLPAWFWIWETIAWSARALIEAGAILYLFETNAQTKTEERTLLMFKILLIALITLTLGAVVGAAGLGQSMSEALPRPLYWAWAFAVASYAPLMIASVGAGYRIQPHDTNTMRHQQIEASSLVEVAPPQQIVSNDAPPMRHQIEASSLVEIAPPQQIKQQSHVNDALPQKTISNDAPPGPVPTQELHQTHEANDDEELDPRVIVPQLLRSILRVDETLKMDEQIQALSKPDLTPISLDQALPVILSIANSYGATDDQIAKVEEMVKALEFPMPLNTLLVKVKEIAKGNGVPDYLLNSLTNKIGAELKKQVGENDEESLWDRLLIPGDSEGTDMARYQMYLQIRPSKNNNFEAAEEMGTSKSTLERTVNRVKAKLPKVAQTNGKGH